MSSSSEIADTTGSGHGESGRQSENWYIQHTDYLSLMAVPPSAGDAPVSFLTTGTNGTSNVDRWFQRLIDPGGY